MTFPQTQLHQHQPSPARHHHHRRRHRHQQQRSSVQIWVELDLFWASAKIEWPAATQAKDRRRQKEESRRWLSEKKNQRTWCNYSHLQGKQVEAFLTWTEGSPTSVRFKYNSGNKTVLVTMLLEVYSRTDNPALSPTVCQNIPFRPGKMDDELREGIFPGAHLEAPP